MEESANGTTEDTQKVYAQDGVEDNGDIKLNDDESVKVAEILKDNHADDDANYSGDDESKLITVNSGNIEEVLGVAGEGVPTLESVELAVEELTPVSEDLIENSGDIGVDENESKTIINNEILIEDSVVSDTIELEAKENAEQFLATINENVEAELASEGIDETKLPVEEEKSEEESIEKVETSLSEKTEISSIVETKLADADESSIVESSSRAADLGSGENIDTSNSGEYNKSEAPETSEYQPPVISVTTRTLQPTSWKSCCGLFEVLRNR